MSFFALADTATNLEPFFLGYGVLGAVFVLVLLGWLAPKWVVDYLRAQIAVKDVLIDELTDALHRLADNSKVEVPAPEPPTARRRVRRKAREGA